jgi:hypothetical protein
MQTFLFPLMGSQEQLHLSWILWHDDITNPICYCAVQGAKASTNHRCNALNFTHANKFSPVASFLSYCRHQEDLLLSLKEVRTAVELALAPWVTDQTDTNVVLIVVSLS